MKISLLQRSTEWAAADNNRAKAEEWIAKCGGSRLVVLPEMFTTGFCTDPKCGAESGEVTLRWMLSMAKKYSTAIAGSVAVEVGGEYFNRFYFVRPDGEHSHYDKRHLFTFAGEHLRYRAGDERVVVELDGIRILLLVCYDLRFPVWSRNRGDYDMILCVAAWPKARRMAWDALLRARAIENLCYVGGVNTVGRDINVEYSGGTVAINFLGEVIERVEDDTEGIATFEVDKEALEAFRASFPALLDADDFEIKQHN